MRAKFINEKFTDVSDPLGDMNIGHAHLQRFEKDLKEIADIPNQDLKKLNFRDISVQITHLRYIGAYLAMFYLEEKYGLRFKPDPHVEWGYEIGRAEYKNYIFMLTWSTTMQSMKLHIRRKGTTGSSFQSANCQSMRSLEVNLLQAYNSSDIELPIPPEKKKKKK